MGAVGEPLNSAALILQGGQQLGQGLSRLGEQQKAEAEANRPVHPIMQQYIERIMAGEDPDALATEARQHPGMRDLLGGGQQPQSTQPGTSQSAPAAAPRASLGGVQVPLNASPGQPAPVPAPQAQVRPQSAPASSLGALGGIAQMGQPIQGAPQVTPQAAGASGFVRAGQADAPAAPPQEAQMAPNGPQNGPPQGGQTAPRRGQLPPISQRDYAQMAPMLQAMSTQQGRLEVAKSAAEARAQVAELQAQNRMLIAQMNEAGRGQRAEQSSQDKAEGRKTQETIATGRNTTSSANVAARNATSRANTQDIVAGGITRTGMQGQTSRENVATRITGGGNKLTPEQQLLKTQLSSAETEAGRLTSLPDYQRGTSHASDLAAAQQRAAGLRTRLDASLKAGAPIEDPSHPEAATATLRVTRNSDGAAIRIPPGQFDPAKYTKR